MKYLQKNGKAYNRNLLKHKQFITHRMYLDVDVYVEIRMNIEDESDRAMVTDLRALLLFKWLRLLPYEQNIY